MEQGVWENKDYLSQIDFILLDKTLQHETTGITWLIMAALRSRYGRYILQLWFLQRAAMLALQALY